jgi:superoxide dismutase, Cu-Zn family
MPPRHNSLIGFSLASLALLNACDREPAVAPPRTNQGTAPVLATPTAPVPLLTADGSEAGSVILEETTNDVIVTVAVSSLPPGSHGLHIHASGMCDAPLFEAAGDHWNPTSRKHGKDNPQGAHMGDLLNIEIGQNGTGSRRFLIPAAKLREGPTAIMDADGASLVIHADPDDYKTDPSGNSGSRMACAVISGPR